MKRRSSKKMQANSEQSAIPRAQGGGINLRRAHFDAGNSKHSSGASFAQEFRVWWHTQSQFSNQREFATVLEVTLETLCGWLRGKAFPAPTHCEKLFGITGLDCFGSSEDVARTEHERNRGLSRAGILKRARRQHFSPGELEECQADPEKAYTIRGDNWIICLECGQLLKQIRDQGAGAHLKIWHPEISSQQYRIGRDSAHPRYGPKRALICNALAKRKADLARANPKLVPDQKRKHLKSPKKGRRMPPEFSRKQAARMRGRRNPGWAKNVRDAEFIWPWVIEGKSIEDVAKIIDFSAGGVWVRLKAILGMPVRKTVKKEPDIFSAQVAAKVLHESGADDAKLKSAIEQLCAQSRSEVAAQNKRGATGVAILLISGMRVWRDQHQEPLSPEAVALRFLADRAWASRRQRRSKSTAPRKHGPDKTPVEKTSWFQLGRKVQDMVDDGIALVSARKKCADKYEYSSVATAHKRYLKYLSSHKSTTN